MTTTTANATFFRVLINPQGNKDIFIIESEILGYKDNTVYARFLFDILKGQAEQYKFKAQNTYMHDTPEDAFKFILHDHFDKLVNSRVWLFAKCFGGGVGVDFKEMIAKLKNTPELKHFDLEKRLREMQSKSTASQKSTQQKPQQYDSLKAEEVHAQPEPKTSTSNQKTYTAAELLDDSVLPFGKMALCVSGPLKGSHVAKSKHGHLIKCNEYLRQTDPLRFDSIILNSNFILVEDKKEWNAVSVEDAIAALNAGLQVKINYMNTERYIQKSDTQEKVKFSTKGSQEMLVSTKEVMISLDEIIAANFYVLSE
ncbi:hypothetical protein [Bacillus cereus group sp. BfR-BA-01318]|uniref:hypothetical protein n=1 Tax=unclassified Bacillus cereus group TaxID=2750818 RepID=UPI001298AABA|nr:hypothetical protein [Bacillus cereus group sp. BfR-BA-01318]MEB9419904.1 hypothetical protein [Bacillus cereus]MRD20720.1 hypothetical protein [Bacillus thuringiensis]